MFAGKRNGIRVTTLPNRKTHYIANALPIVRNEPKKSAEKGQNKVVAAALPDRIIVC